MTINRNQRIEAIMANRSLIIPFHLYALADIYSLIEKHANLTEEDCLSSNSGGSRWQHSVRAALEKRNGIRSIRDREIRYHDDTVYSFS